MGSPRLRAIWYAMSGFTLPLCFALPCSFFHTWRGYPAFHVATGGDNDFIPVATGVTMSGLFRCLRILPSMPGRLPGRLVFLAIFLTFPSGPPERSPSQAGKPPAAAGTFVYIVRATGGSEQPWTSSSS
jgi:hypothetical protein